MSAWWVPFLYLSASDAAFSKKPGLCLALLLFLLPVSPTGISTEAPPCKCGQSSNSRFSQPTLLSRFTNLEIWPEASTKIHLFCFLPSAVVLRYPAGRGLNEALLASRAILEQFRVCWVLVKDLLDIRYVGDGELVAHSEEKLIYFDVRHLFQQPLGILCFLNK